jgi:hypothetical protein
MKDDWAFKQKQINKPREIVKIFFMTGYYKCSNLIKAAPYIYYS